MFSHIGQLAPSRHLNCCSLGQRWRRAFVVFFMAWATGPLVTRSADGQPRAARAERIALKRLPAIIAAYSRERDFSGVVEIWRNDALVVAKRVGAADRSFGTPIQRNTRFQIASVSKLFVTAAVLKLVERGALALTDPVEKYVRGLHPTIARATIEDLLLHRSGLPRDAEFSPWETLSLDDHVARIAKQSGVEGRQGAYSYSNSGFVLLAKAVEGAAGQPFHEFMRRELLGPLNLRDTDYILGEDAIDRLAVGYARGRAGWRVPWRARHRGLYAPGGLYTTASDLARFFFALRRGAVLNPALTNRLFEPKLAVEGGRQRAAYAGLVSQRAGRDYLVIAGSGDGAKASLMFAEHSGALIIILSNNGGFPVNDMMRDVLLSIEGERTSPPEPCRVRDLRGLAPFAGEYEFAGTTYPPAAGLQSYGMVLSFEGTQAYLWDAGDETVTQFCERPDGTLRAAESNDVLISFAEDDGSRVLVLSVEGSVYRAKKKRE